MENNYLTILASELAKLYTNKTSSYRIVDEANIPKTHIAFSDKAIDNWHAILSEASKRGRIIAIIEAVLRDYPDYKILKDLQKNLESMCGCDEIQHISQNLSPSHFKLAPPSLPPKSYYRLIGRLNELDHLLTILKEPDRKSIVAIVGLGGIGKTALAREIVDHCGGGKTFDYIVWTSSKTEHFIGERIVKTLGFKFTFDVLLSDIARYCNRLEITHMPMDHKREAIKHLLANNRVLIVIDNMESIPGREKLVLNIFEILGQSKLLITSRYYIKNQYIFTFNLSGLTKDNGVTFLREESKERGIEIVANTERKNLIKIHKITGGAPLAMRLIVGQMHRQPIEIVLCILKKAAFKSSTYPFYCFIYRNSWDTLNMNDRIVLLDMSVFPPLIGGAVDDVKAISPLEPFDFWSAMDNLIILSLVDKIGNIGQERFALHPLTQHFILSDITEEWQKDNNES